MTLDYDADVRKVAKALERIASALESADDMRERVHQTLVMTQELVPFHQCALLLVDPRTGTELCVVPSVAQPAEREVLLALLSRIYRLVEDAEELGPPSTRAQHLALPVMGLDRVIGVLRVEPPEGFAYDARHLRLLSVVAAQLGAYFTMVKLREADSRRSEELAKAHEFQQLMLGVVGHDLRNPLSVIKIAASELLSRTTDPTQVKNLERTVRNADKANRIISDLLDVTHVRVGGHMPIALQRTDLIPLLENVCDDFRLRHANIELVSNESGSCEIECDPVRLSQMFDNLIGNAVGHGQKGSPVRVELRVSTEDVVLSVHNLGTPIPDDLLPFIFDPFRQGAHRHRRPGGGLGLGLYIVDQVIRAHGGQVTARSDGATGTTFTVAMPRWHGAMQTFRAGVNPMLTRPEDSETQPLTREEADLVMVVDDDVDVREGVAELLENVGFQVAKAAHGVEAIDLLQKGIRPRLVLLDLSMPVMDGWGFLDAIQGSAFATIPVCVISSDAARAVRLSRAGVSAFLQKPVSLADLLQTMQRLQQ
jgi:signal transduction histidine kinase/CheY-like chemotaxis protein